MSVQRQEPGLPCRARRSRAADVLGRAAWVALALALACACGLGCTDGKPHMPPQPVPPLPAPHDPMGPLIAEPVARPDPAAGADPAGASGPVPAGGIGAAAGASAPSPARPAPPGDGALCTHAGCIAPGPVPAQAQCHELRNHATNDRAAPYLVKDGDATSCFYYDVPWTKPSVLVAWQTERDSETMQEWQLFATTGAQQHPAGSAELCVGGGNGNSRYGKSQLIMAHPRGSNDILMPPGVGIAVPPPGAKMVLQWHHLNRLGGVARDSSLVRLCTLPVGAVERSAGMTLLGTETVGTIDGLPPGSHVVEASCPVRDREVSLLMIAPHMNQLGRHLSMSVMRANGVPQTILSLDFRPDRQLMRRIDVTLRPGDRVTTRCTYDNNTGVPVPFGASFHHEQCFVFAIAEPAGALDNGAYSELGVTNTCW
jgi:hypothetical protein